MRVSVTVSESVRDEEFTQLMAGAGRTAVLANRPLTDQVRQVTADSRSVSPTS